MRHYTIIRLVLSFLLIALVFSGKIAAGCADGWTDLNQWGIKPNIGIDAGVKSQPFHTSFGREQFRQDYPETNVYLGFKFHPYVGIEGGYQYTYRQQRDQFYNIGFGVLGSTPAFGATDQRMFISDVYAKGWNANILGFWPICPRTKTDLTMTLGIAWQKMYYSTVAILDANPATPLAMWSSDDRALFRVGLGVRQMITKHFGSRLQVLWEDASKLDATFPVPVGQGGSNAPTTILDNYTVHPRDSYSVLLGFFFQVT